MNTTQFGLFLLALVAPPVYQRIKFNIWPGSFERLSLMRRITGLQIHHGHWGLAWLTLSGLTQTFGYRSTTTIVMFGFGLGLLLDEIIPSLNMPGERSVELFVYRKTYVPTMKLLCVTVAICTIMFLIKS